MKILLTGLTGYIGKRLLPVLLDQGHQVVAMVRDPKRVDQDLLDYENLFIIQGNVLHKSSLNSIPEDIEVAYYFIHSMSGSIGDFADLEADGAMNFRLRMDETKVKQVIYLGGIANDEGLSEHLKSRLDTEEILAKGNYAFTSLRAGIIVGSGSASFEIIRDLVEKLPIMVAPKWLNTKIQPISIRNVIQILARIPGKEFTYQRTFDIGGPQVMTYKEMLLGLAKERGLKRRIITVPVMTPKLSSYWLYFVTSTSYNLAVNLVDSMKVEVIGKPNDLHECLDVELITYSEAIRLAFDKIEQNEVVSSWIDAGSGKLMEPGISRLMRVPQFGCLKDERRAYTAQPEESLKKIWRIGGDTGWYYGDFLWGIRGFLDKIFGGVGLRRGRRDAEEINPGDSLDFWRVIMASKKEKRLLLYAEMKLPGEAWLEFKIQNKEVIQTATFRPKGIWGRLYWFAVLPFHHFIFGGMIKKIAKG